MKVCNVYMTQMELSKLYSHSITSEDVQTGHTGDLLKDTIETCPTVRCFQHIFNTYTFCLTILKGKCVPGA